MSLVLYKIALAGRLCKGAPIGSGCAGTLKSRDLVPHTSREGSTLVAGTGSEGSKDAHMSLCIAWEGGLRTFPGGLLGDVNLLPKLLIAAQWLRILTGRVREAHGTLDRLDDSHFIDIEGSRRKERGRRGRSSLAIPARLMFLLSRY